MLRSGVIAGWLVFGLVPAGRGAEAIGSLPALDFKPWQGYFIGYEQRAFRFGIGCDGKGELTPHNPKGEPVSFMKAFGLTFTVEETMPDGRVVARQIDTSSLETKDEATTKPGKVSFRGRVTGGTTFEVKLEFDGNRVAVGGRILERGKSTNPQRFAIRISMRDAYRHDKDTGRQFERKVRGDELRFESLDGRRGRIRMFEKLDLAKEFGSEGLRWLRFEMASYAGRRFDLSSTPGGVLEVATAPTAGELIRGMVITWRHSPEQDPEGEARLVIEVR